MFSEKKEEKEGFTKKQRNKVEPFIFLVFIQKHKSYTVRFSGVHQSDLFQKKVCIFIQQLNAFLQRQNQPYQQLLVHVVKFFFGHLIGYHILCITYRKKDFNRPKLWKTAGSFLMKNELCPISESSLKKHRNDVGVGLIQDDFKPVWDVSRLRKPYLKPFV